MKYNVSIIFIYVFYYNNWCCCTAQSQLHSFHCQMNYDCTRKLLPECELYKFKAAHMYAQKCYELHNILYGALNQSARANWRFTITKITRAIQNCCAVSYFACTHAEPLSMLCIQLTIVVQYYTYTIEFSRLLLRLHMRTPHTPSYTFLNWCKSVLDYFFFFCINNIHFADPNCILQVQSMRAIAAYEVNANIVEIENNTLLYVRWWAGHIA